ncbi:hypothetical protein [Providencia rettgeri]|nr:hypothetical protein [Providencia rettgeri]
MENKAELQRNYVEYKKRAKSAESMSVRMMYISMALTLRAELRA